MIEFGLRPSIHFSSIDAPPSFLPAKKYSDVSGLEAKYTDPQTKLHYANADEFKVIRCGSESNDSLLYIYICSMIPSLVM